MVEIEDRKMVFKSYKAHARFLKIEVAKLQQLLNTHDIQTCYHGAKIKYELL